MLSKMSVQLFLSAENHQSEIVQKSLFFCTKCCMSYGFWINFGDLLYIDKPTATYSISRVRIEAMSPFKSF